MDGRLHPKRRWALHESTLKAVFRTAFVFFGGVPTLLILLWVGMQFLPTYHTWQASSWERAISAELGLKVSIDNARTLSPSRSRLEGLRAYHPETGVEIATIEALDVERRGKGWAVMVHSPRLQSERAVETWQMVHDWFLCRPSKTLQTVHFGMSDLAITSEAGEVRLDDLQIRWQLGMEQTQATVGFVVRGLERSERILLGIKRSHDRDDPATEVTLKSGASPLPCRWFQDVAPGIEMLGSQASYRGVALLEFSDRTWSLVLDGDLSQVDLGNLTSALPQGITGIAEIERLRVTMRNGQFVQASGELSVSQGGGSIHRDWLVQAIRTFQLRYDPSIVDAKTTVIHFDRLRTHFDLDVGGILVQGTLGTPPNQKPLVEGTIAASSVGELVADSNAVREAVGVHPSTRTVETSSIEGPRIPGWALVHWLAATEASPGSVSTAIQSQIARVIPLNSEIPTSAEVNLRRTASAPGESAPR